MTERYSTKKQSGRQIKKLYRTERQMKKKQKVRQIKILIYSALPKSSEGPCPSAETIVNDPSHVQYFPPFSQKRHDFPPF